MPCCCLICFQLSTSGVFGTVLSFFAQGGSSMKKYLLAFATLLVLVTGYVGTMSPAMACGTDNCREEGEGKKGP